MQASPRSLPAQIVLGLSLGLSTFFALFATCMVLLGQTKYLHFGTGIAALAGCAVVTLGVTHWLKNYLTGKESDALTKSVMWGSVLLPIAGNVQAPFLSDSWWFFSPTQVIIGGLLGIAVAVLKAKWPWALWGVLATSWGSLWLAIVLFWAK